MRTSARLCTLVAATAIGLMTVAAPASAHVSVQPEGTAARGGYATVHVKVPNERDNASTVKVEMSLPAEHPLSSVMPQPVPGWEIEVTKAPLDKPLEVHGRKITEAVSKVSWTATGKGIEPGYFQKFPLSVGRLPENTDQLVLKSVQTYSNKEVVRWIEVPEEGQEAEHPAPVLALSAADEGHGTAGPSPEAAPTAAAQNSDVRKAEGDGTDTTARWLGVTGLVLGALGIAAALFTGRRHTGA
ncbi:YcnI family protein [Streptomyces bacillaris]|uniref:YcnI family copper-binding membrane protein n=1 Tax=Streptomyces bacillaris TaxID=68179 RepID=UPI0037F7C96B